MFLLALNLNGKQPLSISVTYWGNPYIIVVNCSIKVEYFRVETKYMKYRKILWKETTSLSCCQLNVSDKFSFMSLNCTETNFERLFFNTFILI